MEEEMTSWKFVFYKHSQMIQGSDPIDDFYVVSDLL